VIVEKGRVTQAIQVTYEMENEETRAREFKGVVNACKQYSLDEGLIITYGEEGSYEEDGVRVELVSLVSFLLDSKLPLAL